MKCCGKDRKTVFCPDCGNKLGMDGILGLFDYVQIHVESIKAGVDRRRTYQEALIKAGNTPSEKGKNSLHSAEKRLAKWERWQAEFRALLEKDTEE